MHRMPFQYLVLICALIISSVANARGIYQEPEQFLNETFNGNVPKPGVIWITSNIRPVVKRILGHKPSALRIRYWKQEGKIAWILEEIGKDKPITTGIVINKGKIERVKVLVFRESRGWEIRHHFFTRQFIDATLKPDHELDRSIDGISGATLSVRAIRKLSRLALYLSNTLTQQQ